MITLLRMHEGLPAVFADMVVWITSSKRRSRRVNIYNIAKKYELYVQDLRGILALFERAGLIDFVGSGMRLLNKIQLKDCLDHFWRAWVIPSLDPNLLTMDFETFSRKPLALIFQERTLQPFVKGMMRKPKELVIWSLFYKIFNTEESFRSYQRRCIDTASVQQREFYEALGKSGLTLAEAENVCGFNEKVLGELIQSLYEKWLIRLIWKREKGLMCWRIMRFDYKLFPQEIPCRNEKVSYQEDGSMQRILILFERDKNNMDGLSNNRVLLWEYYFELVDKEWLGLSGRHIDYFKNFMEWWCNLFEHGSVDSINIKCGLYKNKMGKVGLLLIQAPFERYVKHAVKWGLLCRNEEGLGMTSLGLCYVDKKRTATKAIDTIWARNQNRLTIIVADGMKFCECGWLDRVAEKIAPGRYLVTPAILHMKTVTINELLCIVGSLIPLLPRQAERLASWIKLQDKV